MQIKQLIYLILIHIFNQLPIKRNKIFLFSYYGSQYGCNPKYITEYILENYPPNKFDIVWAFNDVQSRSELRDIRVVKNMSLKYFYELCTSKVIITNYRTTNLFVKRKNQYYIQTWHSSLRLKQIEKDAQDTLPANYVKMAKQDSKKCDLLLSGCKYSTDIFKRAFWYSGEIFKYGTPRNDVLFQDNTNKKMEVLGKLALSPEVKIILYAPTFRKDNNLEVYDLDYEQLIEKLKNKFGGKWVVLVRLHPHLISKSDQLVYGSNVLDVTSYDDLHELMLISEMLITDYSSLMFDFVITKRPCFLYVPDIEEYTSQDRKLYFDIMKLPFVSATSNNKLFEAINKFHYKDYKKGLTETLELIGSYEEGKASESLLKRIEDVCYSKKGGGKYEAV